MPSKSVDTRPYAGLGPLQELFDAVVLRVTSQNGSHVADLANSEALSQDQAEFLTGTYVLCLAEDRADGFPSTPSELVSAAQAAVTGAGLSDADVVVRVTGMTRRLRLSEVLAELEVGDLGRLFDGVEIARGLDRPEVLQAPFGGCDLWFDLLLRNEMAEKLPLRPWRKGTWLARASFRLGTAPGTIGFTPLALTDEHRKRLELPEGTVRYVEIGIGLLDKPTGNEDIILWMDADLLSTLASYPKSVVAANLQRQMLVDAVTSIVFRAAGDDSVKDTPESQVRDTLLGRVLQMSGVVGDDLSEPLELLRTKPDVLVATIEAQQAGLLEGLRKALASEEQEESQ